MPIIVNSVPIISVYDAIPTGTMIWTYLNTGVCPASPDYSGGVIPIDKPCSVEGSLYNYTGDGGHCFICQPKYTTTEMLTINDSVEGLIHKRITAVFNANGGSGGSSQVRTWGVQNITEPVSPTRAGYAFKGWATTSGAASPNVTLPVLAPNANVTYYAVWEVYNKTIAPILHTRTIGEDFSPQIQVRVQNNDPSGNAIIKMDVDTIPSTSRGSIPYGGYTSWFTVTQPGVGVTVYATAQVSGKAESDVVSIHTG